MESDKNRIITALEKDELPLQELSSFHVALAVQEKLSSENSPSLQKLSFLLINKLLKSSHVQFLDLSIAILRYMSRDKNVVIGYMTAPSFVEFLCLIGGLYSQDPCSVPRFEKVCEETQINSCRCLCNIMFLAKESQILKLLTNRKFLVSILNNISNHEQSSFELSKIMLRLLFLVTALSSEGRMLVIEEYNARKIVIDCLRNILSSNDFTSTSSSDSDPPLTLSEDDANLCCEILKVVFYLNMDLRRKAIHSQQELEELDSLIELCASILMHTSSNPTLGEELHCNAGNALYSIPPVCFNPRKLIGPTDCGGEEINMKPVATLLDILRCHVMNDVIANDVLHPLLALFSQLCRLSRDIRIYMKEEILPPRKDFQHRPEVGKEMRNRLIKLFTHNNTDLKHGAADFLFVLCKEKTDRFVKYTGYGNAAGLLHLRGLLAGGQGETVYSDTDSDSDTEEYKEVRDNVNPVTGHVPPPRANPMANMSEEEKEYLAMQLANQFSKLSSDDILQPMCVGDDGKLIPFQQKVHESKINEEPSSSDDDT